MRQRLFGKLGMVSALSLGGGGLGQVWGATTREDCVATVHEAIDSAVNLLDLAPSYGKWRSGVRLTGIGHGDALLDLLASGPRPDYIQCIANLLDSAGGLLRGEPPARPRDIIAAANANGVAVMGIRAVQAGALTDSVDRPYLRDTLNSRTTLGPRPSERLPLRRGAVRPT